MTEPRGELFDIGYQGYDGPREGRNRARKAIWLDGFRTTLGLGRGPWAKLLPLLLFLGAMFPAVIMAIITSVAEDLPGSDALPGHAEYYQVVSIVLLLFSAIMAPELLCPDRRDNVIHLYLVRPMTPTDYVASRWLAFFSITLALVYSGQVLLLLGFVFAADQPLEYLRENWLDVPRFLGAGLAVAVWTTTIPMAVSAFTDRRAYAAAFVIGLSVISAPMAAGLTECEDVGSSVEGKFQGVDPAGNWIISEMTVAVSESTRIEDGLEPGDRVRARVEFNRRGAPLAREIHGIGEGCDPITGDAAPYVALIDLFRMPIHISDMVFAERNESGVSELVAELPNIVPIGWYLLLTLTPAFALWWRYQRIRI